MKTLSAFFILILCVSAHAAPISKEELKKALDKNPELIIEALRGQKKELFELVLQAQQETQARMQKEEEETKKKEFEESFKNPMVPQFDAKTRIRGNKNAKYTLVEYSDFQCPFCVKGFHNVETMRKKYGEDLRFVFKHLPLTDMHPQALPAAQWVEAAGLQSPEKAWQMHDKFFANQTRLGEELYRETAKELGLDLKKLEVDVKSKAVQERIDADVAEARKFGFSGTPGFLINGIPVRGAYPPEFFDTIIIKIDQQKKN